MFRRSLTFYKPIFQDESLTSWVCRNALSNYQSPVDFVSEWLNPHRARNYDFDRFPIYELNTWLASQSRQDCLSIINNRSEQALMHSLSKTIKIIRRTNSYKQLCRFRPRFCPTCVNSQEPFHRLVWQNSLNVACVRCKCLLETNCGRCQAPLDIMRLQVLSRGNFVKLNVCAFCHEFLSPNKIQLLSAQQLIVVEQVHNITKLEANTGLPALLLDLCNFLCIRQSVPSEIRKRLQLAKPTANFAEIEPFEQLEILRCALYWLQNFSKLTSEFNQEFGLNRRYWNSLITIPGSCIIPPLPSFE